MELGDPLKPEVLRPFATIIVPGVIAVGPYTLLLGYYVPVVTEFWTKHPRVFSLLMATAILAVGFIIADFGELIENVCDTRLTRKNPLHDEQWHEYLRLELNDELIAQRFLRSKVTQFKFELAMVPALVIFWFGLLWLEAIYRYLPVCGFILFTIVFAIATLYLLWESYNSADALDTIRTHILKAIEDTPKGIKRGKD